jgi:steroid 5-alpha reductase family enzyme
MTAPAPAPAPVPDAKAAAAASTHRRVLAAVGVAYLAALAAAVASGVALAGRHPVLVAAAADAVATAVVFGFSVRHGNSSVYDPYWSVAPIPIALYWFASGEGGPGVRAIAVLALVTAWGVRLTVNCLARWRSLAHEDFRYVEIRARAGRAYWPASFVAIHLMPTIWVFLGLLPLYPALAGPARPPNALDAAATLLTAGAIALEAIADRQLHAFLRTRRDPAAVLATGVWARSRHPNYLGEVLFWWGAWLFGVAARPAWAWTVVGPISITLLFVLVSVPWMDRRMAAHHPGFAERMRAVPALLPWPFRRTPT